jgi:uncharacterized delta-60 repeat protein
MLPFLTFIRRKQARQRTSVGRKRHWQRTVSTQVEQVEDRVLLTLGSPDVTFGIGGLQIVDPGNGIERSSSPISLATAPDGKVYGVAQFDDFFAVEAIDNPYLVFARLEDGSPDPDFGTNGFLDVSTVGFDYRVESIAVQPDGLIIVGGSNGLPFSDPGTESGNFGFMRLMPDGSLDSTFGDGGIRDFDADFNDYYLRSIAVRADGRIVGVGTSQIFTGEEYIALMQLTANGNRDTTFGDQAGDGLNLAGFNTRPEVVLIDADSSRIVVVSNQDVVGQNDEDIAVHQFFLNGQEDNLFGGSDAVEEIGLLSSVEQVESATLSGGWIYVAGYRYDGMTFDSEDFVARISRGPGNAVTPTGVWDTSFGGDGFLGVDQTALSVLDADGGGFYLAGDPGDFATGPYSMAISKYTSIGTLDSSFGVDGISEITIPDFAGGHTSPLLRDSSDRLLFARDFDSGDQSFSFPQLHIARFHEFEAPAAPADVMLPAPDTYEILRDDLDLVVRIESGAEIFRQEASTVSLLSVTGSSGDDTVAVLNAGTAVDTPIVFSGDDGNDLFTGVEATGVLNLTGNGGDDVLIGGAANDTLNGGSGRDELVGNSGDDSLNGNGGTGDTLDGGDGDDTLNGGAGNDVIRELFAGDAVLTNSSMTGRGSDTVVDVERAHLIGDGSDQMFDVGSFFTPGQTSTSLFGNGGDDTLIGSDGSDVLVGSGGSDRIEGNAGHDRLIGGSGADTLIGGDGDDFIKGLGGSGDRLSGGDGNDTLNGGRGVDRVIETGDVDFTLTNTSLTGLGTDVVLALEVAEFNGGPSDNTIDVSAFSGFRGFTILRGNGGDDSIVGSAMSDVINGGDGNDTLLGKAGDDTLNGEDGNDGLSGFTGNDMLDGGRGFDRGFGGEGNDTLTGGNAIDTLIGGDGDDSINGNDGTDTLVGGTGNNDASMGDVITDATANIDEAFTLDPLPGWVDQV